jgi:hypothetical protein
MVSAGSTHLASSGLLALSCDSFRGRTTGLVAATGKLRRPGWSRDPAGGGGISETPTSHVRHLDRCHAISRRSEWPSGRLRIGHVLTSQRVESPGVADAGGQSGPVVRDRGAHLIGSINHDLCLPTRRHVPRPVRSKPLRGVPDRASVDEHGRVAQQTAGVALADPDLSSPRFSRPQVTNVTVLNTRVLFPVTQPPSAGNAVPIRTSS